jgi:S1-C subfamily serine protease
MGKILQAYRTTMPFDGGLSPLTDKSSPAPLWGNTDSIQDIIEGKSTPNDIHSRDSNWGDSKDKDGEQHSYREQGDDFGMEDKIRDLFNGRKSREIWVVETKGGHKLEYPNQESIQQDIRDKKINVRMINRVVREAQVKSSNPFIDTALSSSCMVTSIVKEKRNAEIGAAFCIGNGMFLTCSHCVSKYDRKKTGFDKDTIITLDRNGKVAKAVIVNIDYAYDIAILSSDLPSSTLQIEDKATLVGDKVFSVGSPKGFENNVSEGIISSIGRKVYSFDGAPEYIFTDAQILPGNSGGPLISYKDGKVIGIVQMIVSPSGFMGLNAALSFEYIQEFLKRVK